MIPLQVVLSALCGLAFLALVVLIVRDRQPGDVVFYLLAAVEIGLVVQLVLGMVRVFGDHAGVSVAVYVGYLVGALLVLPIGLLWSLSEKSRGGTGVLLVAVLVVPFLFLRLGEIWSTHV